MPQLIIFAGANGCGKTTAASFLLPQSGIFEFVNADEIARGLSPFNSVDQAVPAGRLARARMRDLAGRRVDFALESTLSGVTLAAFLRDIHEQGYTITLHYIYTTDIEVNRQRIARRVAEGGHNIPESDLTRRYKRSIKNFFNIYEGLADNVEIHDSTVGTLDLVASKSIVTPELYLIYNEDKWNELMDLADEG